MNILLIKTKSDNTINITMWKTNTEKYIVYTYLKFIKKNEQIFFDTEEEAEEYFNDQVEYFLSEEAYEWYRKNI